MVLLALHCGRLGHPDRHFINIARAACAEGNRFNVAEPSLPTARGQQLTLPISTNERLCGRSHSFYNYFTPRN